MGGLWAEVIGIAAKAALLVGVLLALSGCEGLPANVAHCATTPVPPPNTTVVAPAPEPAAAALCGFPLSISSPQDGGTVNSPAPLNVQAQAPDPIYSMRVYVDGEALLYWFEPTLAQNLWMANGQHTIEVVAEDKAGYIATATTHVTVQAQEAGISDIQDRTDWLSCSAVFQSGAECAAGLGTAVSSLTQHEKTPSLGGSSAKFSLSGPTAYSNELYWNPLGGGDNVTHFTLDLWFYVDSGDAPQALEFDVNQTFGGTRWTWGSECDFNDTGRWNIWDDLHGMWVPTAVACNHFPSDTWIHLIWTLERVGDQVHYITLSVDDSEYNIDAYYTAQPNWYQDEIDIAFQMDGNYKQEPYDVWLDKVQLLAN
jgi:hypothetical protein